MNKTILGFGLLLVTALLTACHDNPLKSNKERLSTQFLIQASAAAAHRLKPDMDEHETPYVYLGCMKDKEKTIDCAALYQAMADFAKSAPLKDFKGVRVVDLTDKTVFESLRVGYEERLFNHDLGD